MKLICGPMATISHPAFRIMVEQFGGCDEYFTEMINAGTLLTGGPFEKYYIDPTPVPEKVVWQLTGRVAEHMEEAAKVLVKLPGIGIDVNMGCSAPDIYRYGAGISWMIKPVEETRKMVMAVNKVIKDYNEATGEHKRFSVKMRLGDDNFTDEGFFAFADMLADCGAELLTLHPRTKKEKLSRPARYEYCEKLAQRMHERGVQVYLNGNVKDKYSYYNAVARAPSVDGVMISRASVQKPWIFADLKNAVAGDAGGSKSLEIDMEQLAYSYIENIEKYQPQEFWKTRLQRFFAYFAENFKFAHYAQTQFLNAADNTALRSAIKEFFEQCPEERFRKILDCNK